MSFGTRMRAKRAKSGAMLVAALVSSLGMANTMAPPVQASVSGQSQAPREFVNETPAKKRAKPTVVNRATSKGKGYDSRKARRRILMAMAGRENTGRQWIRVRRGLRKSNVAYLLNTEAWRLALIAERQHLELRPV